MYATTFKAPRPAPQHARAARIHHIEAWPSDGGYCPVLCTAVGDGFPKHELRFPTVNDVAAWAYAEHLDLPFYGIGGQLVSGPVPLANAA